MKEQTVADVYAAAADVQRQLAELQLGALFRRSDISEIQGYLSERQVLKTYVSYVVLYASSLHMLLTF
jgi:hypothetical protein